jgi:hypothetical protein
MWQPSEICKHVQEGVWKKAPAIFAVQGVSSDFRRLIKIYDWLIYGKKEGPSSDGPSKTADAPTA